MRRLLPEPGPVDGRPGLEEIYFVPEGRHLRVNFVSSLDGAVEIEGRSHPLGGPADLDAFMSMRAVADVVMVGAGTARTEDYGPVKLTAEARARRTERGQSSGAPLAVVTRHGDLAAGRRFFEGDLIILTTDEVAADPPWGESGAQVIAAGSGRVDLTTAVRELQDRGYERILCEGGPSLTAGLMAAGLIDEICVTISPIVAGEGHRRLSEVNLEAPTHLDLVGLIEADGMLIARYRVKARPDR
jgi:riboflavin biosynthesis pyrimidine reductase